jgi:putative PIN family toxin of toxin-antitoxin system
MKLPVRLVLDTNVLVSGLLKRSGPPARILELILSGQAIPILQPDILDEYTRVLARPRLNISPIYARQMLRFLAVAGEWINPTVSEPDLTDVPDLSDLPFAQAAISSGARILVTGNQRHFTYLAEHGVNVLSPAEFLSLFSKADQ